MRLPQYLAAAILFSVSFSSQANLIWDFFLFGSNGYIETEGTLDAFGEGGGSIVDLVFTSSTREDMPLTGWTGSGGLSMINPGGGGPRGELMAGSVDFSVDILLPIEISGLPVLLPFTQRFTGSNAFFRPGWGIEVGGIRNYVGCAADIEEGLNAGRPPNASCVGFGGTSRIYFQKPRNAVATSVPEPSSLALLGLCALVLIRR